MKTNLRNFTITLIGLSGLLCAVHYYIIFSFFSEYDLYFPLWSIYAFNAVMVFIVFNFISYKVSKGSEKVLSLFLTLTLAKMVFAIVFLLPLFAGKSNFIKTEVINFFIPYFVFLAFEIFHLNKIFKIQQTK